MKKCKKCGKEINDWTEVCLYCGTNQNDFTEDASLHNDGEILKEQTRFKMPHRQSLKITKLMRISI